MLNLKLNKLLDRQIKKPRMPRKIAHKVWMAEPKGIKKPRRFLMSLKNILYSVGCIGQCVTPSFFLNLFIRIETYTTIGLLII